MITRNDTCNRPGSIVADWQNVPRGKRTTMTALQSLLDTYRNVALSEREKGTYFEELIACYLRTEATYKDLYSDVWTYSEWANQENLDKRDTGIDLVAKTRGTGEIHAIQCKLYAETYRLQKADIDSFFTASGKKPFTRRIIVSSTNHWTEHAEEALRDQQPPVTKIDLNDLENSQIDWARYQPKAAPKLKPKKELRKHQVKAVDDVLAGLQEADRGKMIMACGTGKTFTSLKIAEAIAGKGKRVLFLVPSLSLLSQTLTEWTQESATPLHSFAVCSDADVGKKRKKDDDSVQTFTHELRYPATTEPVRLAIEMAKRHDDTHMSVVFSTYHSIDVISKAQRAHGLGDFDLIVCDEAHRTTGATFGDDDESNFVKVHDADFIRSAKRLYMTATPRIYGDSAKASAEKDNVALCSMDDEALYGKELYVITFSESVKRGLLVDYKVIVLAVEEAHVSRRLQSLLADDDNQLKVDDAAKIIGCWKALAKQGMDTALNGDHEAMKRAVAFCQVIEVSKGAKTHKVSSKNIAGMFQAVVQAYQETEDDEAATKLACEAAHVDGSMNASEKEEKLSWLKAEPPQGTCRILSNVRCLSEGVDVPALDAVLFLTPRNSQVDVVQSVGRVMRNAPGKKLGYVILPVVIPAGIEPHEALNDNRTYSVVWQVLQALRSHDDRFDAMVNKLDLIGKDTSKMEVIAITDKIQKKQETKGPRNKDVGKGGFTIGEPVPKPYGPEDQVNLQFEIGEIEKAIYAKLVQKVGNRHHWEDWANDIAKIARTHIARITAIVEDERNSSERAAFSAFANELRDDLNGSVTNEEIIEMLAQHLVTKPVFDALFSDYSFAKNNPMSKAMQGVLDGLQEHRLDKEADTLERFYASVKMRAEGIENAAGKQKIIVELYDKFFRNAFPKMTERLGIVYTPVEVVDFIIHSVNDILQEEFGQTLGSEGVHIIDPFAGTGTFITRLLQSGLITPDQLPQKYKQEIHANEIVLLAYYIAAINIEAVYHSIVGGGYVPFEGICLTDTFQMYEKEDLVEALLIDNSARRRRQRKLDIRVIMGNPPYSVGQRSENDNNDNVEYPQLDSRIRNTYAERSQARLSKGLYDSYIRAIRWASDRIGSSGVIGFVTNAGFVEASTADGLRKCLADEFSSIYIFHLRGNQRTAGDLSRREGGKIFGSGSRSPIAISLLIKNPQAERHGEILFHDIGDYLSREEKLDRIARLSSIAGISKANGWQTIMPDQHGDWLGKRDDLFNEHIVMGDKKDDAALKLFETFSQGVLTARDAWCFNASKAGVSNNMTRMIEFYNAEADRFSRAFSSSDKKTRERELESYIDTDPRKISWSRALKQELAKNRRFVFDSASITKSLYRPFAKQWLYFNRRFNEMVYQMPRIFPGGTSENIAIMVKARWTGNSQIAFITNAAPGFSPDGGEQCFPLYVYDEPTSNGEDGTTGLFEADQTRGRHGRRDAITNEGLAHFKEVYPSEVISKEDVFYYTYGMLHSADYCERYADNLAKELPRIPCVKSAADFWSFSQSGRKLADLHLNYESVDPYPVSVETGGKTLADADYRVEKMKYGKKGKDKDLTTLHYNDKITLTGIPLEAYEYVVNGKPALDWVVERQCVKTDKDSGIVNDANDWAIETMGNPKYPLELVQRVITVSLETMKIVKSLPPLKENLGASDKHLYEVARSVERVSEVDAKAFYASLPKWVSSQKASHVLALNIDIKLSPDEKSIAEFARATPNAVELEDGSYLTKLKADKSYSAIAVFPSGASRTIGEVKDGKIELFGYWSLFDPDESMEQERLSSNLSLRMNVVVVEIKNVVY
jgi:predicted helicase